MLKYMIFMMSLFGAVVSANAAKPLEVAGDELRLVSLPIDLWGVQFEGWGKVADDPDAFPNRVQSLCEHGVNTLGISLQSKREGGKYFASNGSLSNSDGGRLSNFCRMAGDHWMAPVVSVFSSDRAMWLDSADAYRAAAQNVARLVGKRRVAILVAGDLFGKFAWDADCPYPMNDAVAAIELCRLMKAANPEIMTAVPASLFPSRGADALLFAAEKPDALASLTQVPTTAGTAPLPAGVIALKREQFLSLEDIRADQSEALQRYLVNVTDKRLSATMPPLTQPAGKAGEQLTPEEKAEGFIPLFDGSTLNGWTTLRPSWYSWRVEDGAIHCLGKGGQWLRSHEQYGSFVLRLDFKIAKEGNSGVFVWAPVDGRCSRFGMEIQIRGFHRDPPNDDTTGAIYKVLPPKEDAGLEPMRWNALEVECRGSKVKITLNGRLVQDFDADKVPALKDRLRSGLIGLQDHACEAWFRKIRIKPLSNGSP